ncbi:protein PFC0760c [Hydra vulgaris]|uniref:Protein PFC0760c n=1 Tax=Hydra vulgaris TaxID=6087 RepID=A0ABM4BQD1_HYDVU
MTQPIDGKSQVKEDHKQSFSDVYDEFSRFLNDEMVIDRENFNKIDFTPNNSLENKKYKMQEAKTSKTCFEDFNKRNSCQNNVEDKRFSCTSDAEDGDSGFRDITEEDSGSEILRNVFDTEDDTTSFKRFACDFSDNEENDNEETLTFKMPADTPKSNHLYQKNGRTETMNINLLRSTIIELERALSDSNSLLEKRDEEINNLRAQNACLNSKLHNESKNNKQLKRDNVALIKEKDEKINQLKSEIALVDKKNISQINFDESANKNFSSSNSSKSDVESEKNLSCCFRTQNTSQYVAKDLSTENKKNSSSLKCKNNSENLLCTDKNACFEKPKISSEKPSKIELQAQLRMNFMRDAFFYYMIGFHSDEQLNAILAILDYGDKRRDFILEAHKMKKLGKKLNATNVSTRLLTFVQEEAT